jgi:hypothetical protein
VRSFIIATLMRGISIRTEPKVSVIQPECKLAATHHF